MKGEIELSDTLLNSNINTGLVVDPVTRRISAKNDSEKLFVAKNDHNSTVLSFEIPTYIDGHDMSSEGTLIHIHFVNMSAEDNRKTSGGVCDVTATAVKNEDGTLSFSWRIPRIATHYAGVLSVGVTFECYENSEGEAEEVYSWSSAPYGDIVVCDSIDNDKEETEREYSYLVETCNALVMSALKTDLSYLVEDALREAKDSGAFDGEKGDKGDGWVVRGYFNTFDKLKVSIDSPVQGETYAVGKREPYTYYTYDSEKGFVSQGTFSPALAESFARGGTGVRAGEDTDNSKFYFEQTKERFNSTANCCRSTANGINYVKIRDVSPFEHDMKVTVTSPYIVPLAPYDIDDAEELGGVHADVNDDGTIFINGICNSEESKGKYVVLKEVLLEAGLYSLTLTKSVSDSYLEVVVATDSDFETIIERTESLSGESATTFFDLYAAQKVYVGVKTEFSKGENYALSFKPKLYKGKVERYDLSDVHSIDVVDDKGNITSYPCAGKASDTSLTLNVKSTSGYAMVKTGVTLKFYLNVEYNSDTNFFNNKFSQSLDGFATDGSVLFLDKVASNPHFVTVGITSAANYKNYRYFKVYGTNLLNLGECILNNCEVINNIDLSGITLRNLKDTYGAEVIAGNTLKEILSNTSDSTTFTFSTRSKYGEEEYMMIRILYTDGSQDEFIGEKESSVLTFVYALPTGKEISDIYLYPRKQDTLVTSTKNITGIQFEVGYASDFCQYTEKEYDVRDGKEGELEREDCILNIPSISPKMTIKANLPCVVDAYYKKDINKVIEELQNAILSLGGNI